MDVPFRFVHGTSRLLQTSFASTLCRTSRKPVAENRLCHTCRNLCYLSSHTDRAGSTSSHRSFNVQLSATDCNNPRCRSYGYGYVRLAQSLGCRIGLLGRICRNSKQVPQAIRCRKSPKREISIRKLIGKNTSNYSISYLCRRNS